MLRTALALLIALVLPACSSLTSIIATSPPPPSQAEVVRLLCTRAEDGSFVFGPILISRRDVLTDGTLRLLSAHSGAWDIATDQGKLCGSLGAAPFGGMKWGTPNVVGSSPPSP